MKSVPRDATSAKGHDEDVVPKREDIKKISPARPRSNLFLKKFNSETDYHFNCIIFQFSAAGHYVLVTLDFWPVDEGFIIRYTGKFHEGGGEGGEAKGTTQDISIEFDDVIIGYCGCIRDRSITARRVNFLIISIMYIH